MQELVSLKSYIPRKNFYDIFKHLIAKLKWLIGKAFIVTF